MKRPAALLDTDTLSEIIKGRDTAVERRAREYLAAHSRFQYSIISRHESWRAGGS